MRSTEAAQRIRRAPSPLVGEGWGGGSLLLRDGVHQQRPPPLTPPHRKSGLPDLRNMVPHPGKPGLGGEGNRPSVWRSSALALVIGGRASRTSRDPPPQPSPTRGEGAGRVCGTAQSSLSQVCTR